MAESKHGSCFNSGIAVIFFLVVAVAGFSLYYLR